MGQSQDGGRGEARQTLRPSVWYCVKTCDVDLRGRQSELEGLVCGQLWAETRREDKDDAKHTVSTARQACKQTQNDSIPSYPSRSHVFVLRAARASERPAQPYFLTLYIPVFPLTVKGRHS